jgi:hypothetical protein
LPSRSFLVHHSFSGGGSEGWTRRHGLSMLFIPFASRLLKGPLILGAIQIKGPEAELRSSWSNMRECRDQTSDPFRSFLSYVGHGSRNVYQVAF